MKKIKIPNIILYMLSIWFVFAGIKDNNYFYLLGSVICIAISMYHNWQDKNKKTND